MLKCVQMCCYFNSLKVLWNYDILTENNCFQPNLQYQNVYQLNFYALLEEKNKFPSSP